MTNKEKFEEVFKVEFTEDVNMMCSIAPDSLCRSSSCDNCPYGNWWNEEYKEPSCDS